VKVDGDDGVLVFARAEVRIPVEARFLHAALDDPTTPETCKIVRGRTQSQSLEVEQRRFIASERDIAEPEIAVADGCALVEMVSVQLSVRVFSAVPTGRRCRRCR